MMCRSWAVGLSCVVACLFSSSLFADSNKEIAQREMELALSLKPNIDRGRKLYEICAVCHTPEGWGTDNGYYPQIAGQLSEVVIKQLADIRARNRDNPTMFPFAMPSSLGGAQEMADVAAYIEKLPFTPLNGVGPGYDLALGERIYKKECAECHGDAGEGNRKDHVPLIQGQHYDYLVRQFRWIQIGRRRNADDKMVKQIQRFSGRDIMAVMDYTSRLRPPENRTARADWRNPDFPKFYRAGIYAYAPNPVPPWEQAQPQRPDWVQPPMPPGPPESPSRNH